MQNNEPKYRLPDLQSLYPSDRAALIMIAQGLMNIANELARYNDKA